MDRLTFSLVYYSFSIIHVIFCEHCYYFNRCMFYIFGCLYFTFYNACHILWACTHILISVRINKVKLNWIELTFWGGQRQVGDHVTHCVLTQIASIYAKLALGKEANFQLATTAVFLDRFASNLVWSMLATIPVLYHCLIGPYAPGEWPRRSGARS